MFGWRKRAVFALTATLLLAGVWAFVPMRKPPVHDFPSQLTDAEFWTMIETFSEPNGFFRSDNLLSNEAGLQATLPELKERVKPGGIYVGVGPEQNFTYILNLEPRLSFIVDIRRMNMLEHLLYKALFELSTDRADFLARLFSRARPKGLRDNAPIEFIFDAFEAAPSDKTLFERNLANVLLHLSTTRQFRLSREDEDQIRYVYNAFFSSGPELSYTFNDSYYQGTLGMPTYRELMLDTDENDPPNNLGFLGSEERFRRLQSVQRKNLIVPLVGDFAGPKTLKRIARYLREHNAVVTAFYTSNVEMYLFQEGQDWKRFYDNVRDMPTDASSTFIRFTIGRRRVFDADQGMVPRHAQMWSSIDGLLAAVQARKVDNYADVIDMSR
jgi:hypothetical protein